MQSQRVAAGICQWRPFPLCLLNNNFPRSLGDGYARCGIRGQAIDGKISEATPDNLPVNAKAGAAAPNPTWMQPKGPAFGNGRDREQRI
jgi:hypothetical protein